ncbi:MAG: transposase [Candidatus Omnitrophota bacterium]
MARMVMVKNKVIVAGAIYHIIQHAPGKEIIFVEDKDYLKFLFLLKDAARKYSLEILAFSLLPNHLHILLKTKEENLSAALKNFLQRYAMYLNKKYERKGHVFYGRYRASLCDSDDYFFAIAAYIHLNSFKAGLSDSPFLYRWHSLDVYLKDIKQSFVNPAPILDLLSGDRDKARKIYCDLIKQAAEIKGLKRKKYIFEFKGLRNFYKDSIRIITDLAQRDKANSKKLEKLLVTDKWIKEFREKKCLKSPQSIKAKRYVVEQLLSRGLGINDIAEYLQIDRSSIYRLLHIRH